MTTVEVLRNARALIDTPEKWTKGAMRIDRPGGGVAYCLNGALFAVPAAATSATSAAVAALYRAIRGATDTCLLSNWNDALERTHADVLAAIDTAIAEEEAS